MYLLLKSPRRLQNIDSKGLRAHAFSLNYKRGKGAASPEFWVLLESEKPMTNSVLGTCVQMSYSAVHRQKWRASLQSSNFTLNFSCFRSVAKANFGWLNSIKRDSTN